MLQLRNFRRCFNRFSGHCCALVCMTNLSTSPSCLSLKDLKHLKKLSKHLIELKPEDIRSKTIKGWGSGGQKVNKTQNCVQIKHIPTGITVKIHDSRVLEENQNIAILKLRAKVDEHLKGTESIIVKNKIAKSRLKRKAHADNKDRMAKILAFKNANPDNDVQYD